MASLPELMRDHEGVAMIIKNPSLGHQDALREVTALGFTTSDTAIRRARRAIGYHRNPDSLHMEPGTGEVEAVALDGFDLLEKLERLGADNRRLFKAYTKEKARGEEYVEAVYRAARDAAEYSKPPQPLPKSTKDKRSGRAEVALWHTTDWQRGKKTDTYSSIICDERVMKYTQKAIDLTEIQRKDHPVTHGIVLATGDMVEGCNIFPGQVFEIDAMLFEQMMGTADMLEWQIREALKCYETVDFVGEWGNHGRLGKKGEYKASDNVDRMVYEIVRQRLSHLNDRLLNFKVSSNWYQHHSVGNYSFMAVHGDEIKSFGGNTPAFGILRKGNAWASGVATPFRDLYIGHYHQSMQLQLANGGSVFMTGSPESDNQYAKEFVAATGDPSQRVNFVDPIRGRVTAEYRVWL